MGIIYKTTNLINGKFCVGKDVQERRTYYGSGVLILKAKHSKGWKIRRA